MSTVPSSLLALEKAENLCKASYQDLGTPSEVEQLFRAYLLASASCRIALRQLLEASSQVTRDYALEIDAFDLLHRQPVVGHLLLKFPQTLLSLLEKAIVTAQQDLQRQWQHETTAADDDDEKEEPKPGTGRALTVKGDHGTRVHARIYHLPPTCCRSSVACHASDVGKLVQLSGTVVRTSPIQMYESARSYQCTTCKKQFLQDADLEEKNNALKVPPRCPLFHGAGIRCTGTKLTPVPDGAVHTDYQEMKIQEAASTNGTTMSNRPMPRSLLIKLQHDLVDSAQPGDEVVVVGILLAQWQTAAQVGVECSVGMALKAHSVTTTHEQGSSAYMESNVGELTKYKKEFDTFWEDHEENVTTTPPPRSAREYPIAARDFICKAVCPKLYGLQVIKLALLMTLIGGVSSESVQDNEDGDAVVDAAVNDEEENNQPDCFRLTQNAEVSRSEKQCTAHDNDNDADNTNDDTTTTTTTTKASRRKQSHRGNGKLVKTKRRDMSHLLIIGDPGTGKSQVLRFASVLCPRSVMTTGVGTTSAGLTCAAIREGDDKEFALEAGALVLADKGVCLIDEFGCIRNEDRTSIHEAMEQQTLSVAKAGIVCKLNCRATIIAVMNPRDCIYDNQLSLAQNTGLGTPLLSRFDLIFKLIDSSDAERDSNVTTYLLNRAIQGTGFECANNTLSGTIDDETPWSIEKLRAYIAIVKEKFQPIISDEAAILLEAHYEKIRSSQSFTIPVTVRFLESLIRLSQSHARLMYRNTVTLEDAVAVLRIMECSAMCYGGFDGNVPDPDNILYCDPMHMDTCMYQPDENFLIFEYNILKRYNMLEYMSNDSKNKVLAILDGDDGIGMHTQNDSWLNIETNVVTHEDHYGRAQFSPQPPSQRTPNSSSNSKRRKVQ